MDDTISREAARRAVRKLYVKEVITEDSAYNMAIDEADDVIRKLPSAERRGRWNIKLDRNRFFYECQCSVCGHTDSFDPKYRWFNYCPNCGSFNGEGGENEELQR